MAIAAGKIEITQNVIELQQTLLSLQSENAELAEQNRDLKKKINELLDQMQLRENFSFDRNACWRGEGEDAEGPFCSRCLDADTKAIRMIQFRKGFATCPNCKNAVTLSTPTERSERSERTVRMRRPNWVDAWKG